MGNLFGLLRRSRPESDELDEWARHHDDPRSQAGYALFCEAMGAPDLTDDELRDMWQRANKLVGQRAPADYGEFLAYGYLEGRREATRFKWSPESDRG